MEKPQVISPYGVRIPSDLKAWIKDQSKKNRRSMNTEIIWIIEQFKNQHDKHA